MHDSDVDPKKPQTIFRDFSVVDSIFENLSGRTEGPHPFAGLSTPKEFDAQRRIATHAGLFPLCGQAAERILHCRCWRFERSNSRPSGNESRFIDITLPRGFQEDHAIVSDFCRALAGRAS